jgi:ketosteroid isomerase-like protein
MSRENVDAWRRILAAYDRRDRSAFLAAMHDDVETIPLPEWPEPGPYVGEDVWNFHVAFADAWGEATPPRPTELLDLGDKLITCLERTALGGASHISVSYSVYGVITFRDGKVASLQWFQGREEALAAAGPSES